MDKFLSRALWIAALVMVIAHILYVFYPMWSFGEHSIIHVMMALAIVLLDRLCRAKIKYKQIIVGLMLVLSLASVSYVLIEATRLELKFGLNMTTMDFAVGCIILIVILAANYMIWGHVIPILAIIAILYMFFGHNIPGPLGFPEIGTPYVMAFLGMGVSAGVFGFLIPVSASLVFYFMVFGGVMQVTGVLPMFLEVGKLVGRRMKGGAAYTSIVGSSLIGTVTGSTAANVAFTGQYTIPAMKEQGFSGPSASAVESVASMGGQLLPPVMGAGALLMSVITDEPYINICLMALLPAFLYYAAATISTTLMIRHYKIPVVREEVNIRLILERLPVFIIPLGILVIFLVMRFSPAYAITVALFSCIFISLLLKSTRSSFKELLNGFARGARMGAEMAVVVMAIAIIAQAAITTGLGPKLAHVVRMIAGGAILPSLLLLMVVCLFLGLGMPTVAAYTIVALIVVPGLITLGVEKFAAHFFAFYFAILAAVTPPVATAAIVGSKIAGSNFWQCALHGFKLALPLFAIPFAIAIQPQILDFPFIGITGLIMVIATLLFGGTLSMSLYRYFLVRIDNLELALCLLSAGASLAYIMLAANSLLIVASVVLLAVVSFRQFFRRKRQLASKSPIEETIAD